MNNYWEKRCSNGAYKKELESDNLETKHNFDMQEQVLKKNLKKFSPKIILEIGCGTGRVTKILSEVFPDAEILATDLVQDNLDVCPKLPNVKYEQRDILAEPPTKDYDLIITAEVLMHLKDIRELYQDLQSHSKVLVHIDAIRDYRTPFRAFLFKAYKILTFTPEHCFNHNYMDLNHKKTMYIEPIKYVRGYLANYFEIK